MTTRIRVERALTLSDPGIGWVVIAGDQGGYCATFPEAIALADSIAKRRARLGAASDGVACRAELHELCHAHWCGCECHTEEAAA